MFSSFSYFTNFILAFLIGTSFASPLIDPHSLLPLDSASSKSALIPRTIPSPPNPQVPAHQPRAIPAHRSSAAVLRFGSWRLIYQKITAVIPAPYDDDPIKQTILASFNQLWDKVTFVVGGLRDTNEDVVQPWHQATFSTPHIELFMTSADAIIWKDLGEYADALIAMVGSTPKFWEGWGIHEETGQYIYTVLNLKIPE